MTGRTATADGRRTGAALGVAMPAAADIRGHDGHAAVTGLGSPADPVGRAVKDPGHGSRRPSYDNAIISADHRFKHTM